MKALLLVLALSVFPVLAEPIEDNSVLLEEAYTQEPGIDQFIFKYENRKNKDWSAQFENEIPLGGQPAVSYSHNVKPYADEYSVIAYFSAEGPL
jgi:hypothetical protein